MRAIAADTTEQRVLLINSDDSRLVDILRSYDYEVVVSSGVCETSRRHDEGRFGAVICDWRLGGLDLLERIRGNGDNGYTYVVLLGESADEMRRGMAAGADDFLLKPLDPELILARLRVAERIGLMQRDIASKNRELFDANQRLTEANNRMRQELDAAARVQKALLPSSGFKAPGIDIGWCMRPCSELAGDILNVIRLDEHHVAFYVLDVSGHGVSSALLSVQVSRLISPLMTESDLLKQRLAEPPWYRIVKPVGVMQRLNEIFQAGSDSSQYFTIVYGLLHVASGRLSLATAGHPGPVVVPASGQPFELSCRSHPIGLFDIAEFCEHELVLDVGDRVWFFSDGVTDIFDEKEEMLGRKRLRRYLDEQRHQPAQRAVDAVLESSRRWCAPDEPDDDCSLLAIERLAQNE